MLEHIWMYFEVKTNTDSKYVVKPPVLNYLIRNTIIFNVINASPFYKHQIPYPRISPYLEMKANTYLRYFSHLEKIFCSYATSINDIPCGYNTKPKRNSSYFKLL